MKLSVLMVVFTSLVSLAPALSMNGVKVTVERERGLGQQSSPTHYSFIEKLVDEVKPHFTKEYSDAPEDVYVCQDGTRINRPNHGLAHGLRQAYLAGDITVILATAAGNSPLQEWLRARMGGDKDFLLKLEFANAFQRSGRESDIARQSNPTRYEQYLRNDEQHFLQAAKNNESLWSDDNEKELFKEAITILPTKVEHNPNLLMLSKIAYVAHQLDLRRIPDFHRNKILGEVETGLFDPQNITDEQKNIVDKLWARAGIYLAATGDRDLDDSKKKDYDDSVFCAQTKEPHLMIKALEIARSMASAPLESPFHHTDEENRHIEELRETLANAPYTASDAYLKISLGEEFSEVPFTLSESEAREITEKNLRKFLAQEKRLKRLPNGQEVLVARIENPDQHYVDTLVDAMMAERKNRGKIVLYHSTEPEMGLLLDVFSEMRNRLALSGGRDIRVVRVLDEGFMKLDKGDKKANVRDFMKVFAGVADSTTGFSDVMLSTNFAIPGSDLQPNADTYNMFFEVKDKKVVTTELKYKEFMELVEAKTGIPSNFEEIEKLMKSTVLQCENETPCRNGRLIQIFVDPSVIADMAYLSVLMGALVLKGPSNGVNPGVDETIKILRTTPEKFSEFLRDTRGSEIATNSDLLRLNGPLQLHDLQVRFFPRPEAMQNGDLITLKSYWRHKPGANMANYHADIARFENGNVTSWLERGAQQPYPPAIVPELMKLPQFMQMVHEGIAGKTQMSSVEATLEQQFVALVDDGKDEAAAAFLAKNFDYLKDKQFATIPSRADPKSYQYSLMDFLLKRCVTLPLVIKVGFDEGIFAGKEAGYEVYLRNKKGPSLLKELNSLKHPELTSKIYLEYFGSKDATNLLGLINYFGNDEALVKEAALLKDRDDSAPLLNLIKKVAPSERLNIASDIVELYTQARSTYRITDTWVIGLLFVPEFLTARESLLASGKNSEDVKLALISALKISDKLLESRRSLTWNALAKCVENVPASTLLRVTENIMNKKEIDTKFFILNQNYVLDLNSWCQALKTVEPVEDSELGLPNKSYLRAILIEPQTYIALAKQNPFEFVDGNKKWRLTNATLPNRQWNPNEFIATVKKLAPLSLHYAPHPTLPGLWLIKFQSNGEDMLTIDLADITPK